ncbi:hypothetical protein JTE90_006606 [Oedothorax gibbosus]|uniref:Uncharacterized protein n=1 Tax=Oedothorax gibbosus TaxID=931172 RepID=A0AAV6U694_9ARAC|nr:hypothetical protein JTE90_006606 [Oedothorax gibbosus]
MECNAQNLQKRSGTSSAGEGPGQDRSWKADIETEEDGEGEDIDKMSVLSGGSHGSSAYSCSTSGSSRTCSSSVGSSTSTSSSSSSSCSCSASDSSEFDPRAHLPYPAYVPISWYCLEQTTRPRNWCLWLISNPYPFKYIY